MLKVTLDTNCLIDVQTEDQGDGSYSYLDIVSIINRNKKDLDVAVVAASASEIRINQQPVSNISEFFMWLEMMGMGDLAALKPIAYWGIAFWGWAVYGGGKGTELDNNLHQLLFPNIPLQSPSSTMARKWRNAKHDVLIVWAHTWNKHDVFITRDSNFLRKRDKLAVLGTKEILHPREFLQKYP